MTPLISVVLNNRNCAEWIEAAIESVLAQTHRNFELLIVDDVSTDTCPDIIRKYEKSDPRVRGMLFSEPHGLCASRNAGIEQARGEYLIMLDSDDEYLPTTLASFLEKFLEIKATRPDLVALTSDAWLIDERGRRKGRYMPKHYQGRTITENPPLFTLPSTYFFASHPKLRFFDSYRAADGLLFLYRAQAAGTLAYCGEPLINYRVRRTSGSDQNASIFLREVEASRRSQLDGRLDDPYLANEVPEPSLADVRMWRLGRLSKALALNGDWPRAAFYAARCLSIAPRKTLGKIRAALGAR